MSKKKGKVKTSKEKKQFVTTQDNINFLNSFTAEQMQQIITNALLAAEEYRKRRLEEQKEKDQEKLQKAIGYNDYTNETGLKRFILILINRLKLFLKFLFMPKHLIKGDGATFGLLKTCAEYFFLILQWTTTLFSIIGVIYIPLQYVDKDIVALPVWETVLLGCFAFISFVLSRMFRMVYFEIHKIEDRSLLFGIFTSITSIISIVLATIAILK